jgi:hypothetical protein
MTRILVACLLSAFAAAAAGCGDDPKPSQLPKVDESASKRFDKTEVPPSPTKGQANQK